MVCVTNMYQHLVPLICLSGKNAVADIHFMYICHVRPSQQDSCGTVAPKSTLSGLNKWFYGAIANSWCYN